MNVELRAYRKEDFKELENIIRKTWHYDDLCGPKTAEKLAKVFLSSCLTNYTFSKVAVLDGQVEGIILVKNIAKYHCPLRDRLFWLRAVVSLFCSKEGRQVSKVFGSVEGIDKQLLKEKGTSYPAELALFAVSENCRGKGIGKILYQSALEYMQEEGLDCFYLFTDTSCNYGFYEHQGMKRQAEKSHTFEIRGQKATMNFFIYDGRSSSEVLQ